MEIKVATERILLLQEQFTDSQAEDISWKNKSKAFGAFHQVSTFLNRPNDDDFSLIFKEKRLLPFWHIEGTANYTYDRTVTHEWPTGGSEVKSLTLQGTDYKTENGIVTISVMEHCTQQYHEDFFVDGVSTVKNPDLKKYLQFSNKELEKTDIQSLAEKSIIVPPQTRASALVREAASKMIQSIQADHILEEDVQFQHVDLYYRPVFTFKYHWKSKNKNAVVEIDGLTGRITFSQENFQQIVGSVFDYDFLFDIGKDAAGMILPGSSIAIKIAKKYMDVTKQKK